MNRGHQPLLALRRCPRKCRHPCLAHFAHHGADGIGQLAAVAFRTAHVTHYHADEGTRHPRLRVVRIRCEERVEVGECGGKVMIGLADDGAQHAHLRRRIGLVPPHGQGGFCLPIESRIGVPPALVDRLPRKIHGKVDVVPVLCEGCLRGAEGLRLLHLPGREGNEFGASSLGRDGSASAGEKTARAAKPAATKRNPATVVLFVVLDEPVFVIAMDGGFPRRLLVLCSRWAQWCGCLRPLSGVGA